MTDADHLPGADGSIAGRSGLAPSLGRREGLRRSYLVTLAGSAGVLVLTLFTGVVSARLLGPDGRGAVGAIAAWAMLASFIGGLELREGMGWLEARDGRRGPRVLTSTLVSTIALALVTILATQLFVPIGFSAQSETVVRTAQVAMIWVLPLMMYNAMGSILGARQRFVAITIMRVGQPFSYAVGLGAVWWIDRAGVGEVVAIQALSFLVPAVLALVVLGRESGMGRFDAALTRQGAAYGFRAYGGTLGQLANSRLDILVLPAILLAGEIGLYVVAVSAATVIVGLFGSLNLVVFPAATRAGGAAGVALAQRAIRLVLLASTLTAVTVGGAAPWLVALLYGPEFSGAVTPLRLLLPGTCCWAAAAIVGSGLKAIGRPGSASVAQFVGVGVTLAGLALLLRPFGIEGAAITSSLSFLTVLVVSLVLFARASGTTIASTLDAGELTRDIASVTRRITVRRP